MFFVLLIIGSLIFLLTHLFSGVYEQFKSAKNELRRRCFDNPVLVRHNQDQKLYLVQDVFPERNPPTVRLIEVTVNPMSIKNAFEEHVTLLHGENPFHKPHSLL